MAAYSTSAKTSWLMCLGLLLLALLAPQHAEAHGAMLYPPPRGGVGTKSFNWRIHTFIDYKGFKFPCGGYNKPGPVTEMKAGDVIPVRFWTAGMNDKRDEKRLPTKKISQARHGGGLCEFSLSYDGGATYHVIGTYTKTCPDIYYEWKVRIPRNVPSCTKTGQCLFAFSWTASLVPQFYHNCADVRIQGVKGGKLPSKMMQRYDYKAKGVRRGVTFPGDGKSHERGSGPNKSEERRNLRG
ncbi:hypothetical protein BGZ70_009448 [Mortierella alpina]|uniref:Uncharacterized protein n=1 Tax=Mortierella alpina TaxID=64518 RepID=A0A9P6M6F0_MORAP|nr:hypothetical protein BGZ70_009448 [Mortierella alpina]